MKVSLVILPPLLTIVSLMVKDSLSQSRVECSKHKTCGECIQTLDCMWCKDKELSLDSRCFANNSRSSRPIGCKDLENPQGGIQDGIHDGSSASTSNDSDQKPKAPVVRLKLRKGQRENITFDFTDTEQKPLDLYIVMDLSCSMKKHKENVATLTSGLAQNLKNLTNKLRIGFGSFVDKPLAPFGLLDDTSPPQCDDKKQGDNKQTRPYGFKNHLKLTDDVNKFINEVKSAGISSNIDSLEGTLDGLLQSVVCEKEIGWRRQEGNRKLIVISTDGPFHLAGDGKLVGVVLPHDGVCHIDSASGLYTQAAILDYPSISVIRRSIRENDVFVIFAVTEDQMSSYNQLTQQLRPFAVTQRIDDDDDNSIARVIENQYRTLVNTVTLLSQYTNDYINVKFYIQCPGEKHFKAGDQCKGVSRGESVRYKVEVELKSCPSKPQSQPAQITVYPQSSAEHNIILLDMLCECGCEAEENQPQPFSNECSNHGSVQCGICKCERNWGGPICNCTRDPNGGAADKSKCLNPETNEECSNQGTCDICGNCNCKSGYGGQYCQCNNMDCPIKTDEDEGLCNQDAKDGPHGLCKCSSCSCNAGFEGPRCECPKSNGKCRDPKSPDKICNGLAQQCRCGKCFCGEGYTGKYCEIQHAAQAGSCENIMKQTNDCVQCLVSQNEQGEYDDEVKKKNCKKSCQDRKVVVHFKNQIVGKFNLFCHCGDIGSLPDDERKNVCQGTREDSNECRIDYIIRKRNIHDGSIFMEVETGDTIRTEKCPKPPPLVEIMISVVGAMVLIGIFLLLLWKVVTYMKDKREYARFEKAINEASWDMQNPLYKSTTSEFQNPAYSENPESEPVK